MKRKGTGDLTRLNRIHSSTERMSNMVAQLLDLTRSRLGGGIPIEPRPTDLLAVTAEAIDELRLVNPGRDIRLEEVGGIRGLVGSGPPGAGRFEPGRKCPPAWRSVEAHHGPAQGRRPHRSSRGAQFWAGDPAGADLGDLRSVSTDSRSQRGHAGARPGPLHQPADCRGPRRHDRVSLHRGRGDDGERDSPAPRRRESCAGCCGFVSVRRKCQPRIPNL